MCEDMSKSLLYSNCTRSQWYFGDFCHAGPEPQSFEKQAEFYLQKIFPTAIFYQCVHKQLIQISEMLSQGSRMLWGVTNQHKNG